ncbi:hypothetical protein ACNF49_46950 [Actinomadura sp. ATCC 39365]
MPLIGAALLFGGSLTLRPSANAAGLVRIFPLLQALLSDTAAVLTTQASRRRPRVPFTLVISLPARTPLSNVSSILAIMATQLIQRAFRETFTISSPPPARTPLSRPGSTLTVMIAQLIQGASGETLVDLGLLLPSSGSALTGPQSNTGVTFRRNVRPFAQPDVSLIARRDARPSTQPDLSLMVQAPVGLGAGVARPVEGRRGHLPARAPRRGRDIGPPARTPPRRALVIHPSMDGHIVHHAVRIVANRHVVHFMGNGRIAHFMENGRVVRLIVDGRALHAIGSSVIGRVVQPVVGSRVIRPGVDGRGAVVFGGGGFEGGGFGGGGFGGGGSEAGALFVPFVYRRPAVSGRPGQVGAT